MSLAVNEKPSPLSHGLSSASPLLLSYLGDGPDSWHALGPSFSFPPASDLKREKKYPGPDLQFLFSQLHHRICISISIIARLLSEAIASPVLGVCSAVVFVPLFIS